MKKINVGSWLRILVCCVLVFQSAGCKKKSNDSNNTNAGGTVAPAPNPTTPQHKLSIAKTGTGSGTVTSTPGSISCGAVCDATLNEGTVVTLTATPDSDSVFADWSGARSGTGTCQVTLSDAKNVTARFEKKDPDVIVTKIGTGSGAVTSSPAGIDCGSDCKETYTKNASVTLTATADVPDSQFVGWSGDCTGTGNCNLTVDNTKSVIAEFKKIIPEVIVTKSGSGLGTVTSVPAGIDCGSDCSEIFTINTTVTLNVIEPAGSKFVGWSGACSGTGACSIVADGPKKVNAQFDKITPEMIVSKTGDGSGTVQSVPSGIDCGSDCSEIYAYNTSVQLTATPADAFSEFVEWSGDCTGTGACTTTMDKGRNVTAQFQKVRKAMTVTKSGAGKGTVVSAPTGIDCGADCSENFLLNTVVDLTATPFDAASEFDQWTGACTGSANRSVTMSDARAVDAAFRKSKRTLTVAKSGLGQGTVDSDVAGISCGLDCTEPYDYGTKITLTPTASGPAYAFASWSGDCTGSGACTVTMDQARSVTAQFDKVQHPVTVSKIGDGSGSVASSPTGISCGADCTEKYDYNTSVTLTPTAADRFSEFNGWTGDCSGTGACTVTTTQARTVTAEFRKVRKVLTVTKSGPGKRGTISSSPVGIDCGLDCSENYLLDTSVTLTPTPADASSEFDHWTGDCTGSGGCTVKMDNVRSVDAVFRISKKTLTVTKSGTGTGTVTSSPAGVSCGADCSEAYDYGKSVSLTMTQGTGYFTGWTGACSGDSTCNVTMDAARSVDAAFNVVSVDGDYCVDTGIDTFFCFFVRNNAVVQSVVAKVVGNVTNSCRNNFFSGNSISNRAFNADNGNIVITGNFLSAYRVSGHYDGTKRSCPTVGTDLFDFEATRPTGASASSLSNGGNERKYDPNYKD